MLNLELILSHFPPYLRENQAHKKYLIKEYLQLLILDFLSTTTYVRNIVFIGGTNLRLVKGIDRFSEDLDFDCKNLSEADFNKMTDAVVLYLQRFGYRIETRDKPNPNLIAFRRNIYFPELLFDLNLSAYKEERFLIKMESQDQGIDYKIKMAFIQSCGFSFSFPVPEDSVLCSMKIAALLNRSKGRDFYDTLFLFAQTKPDFNFLFKKLGIADEIALKEAFKNLLLKVDIKDKVRDFEHLLFNKQNSNKILYFDQLINSI